MEMNILRGKVKNIKIGNTLWEKPKKIKIKKKKQNIKKSDQINIYPDKEKIDKGTEMKSPNIKSAELKKSLHGKDYPKFGSEYDIFHSFKGSQIHLKTPKKKSPKIEEKKE